MKQYKLNRRYDGEEVERKNAIYDEDDDFDIFGGEKYESVEFSKPRGYKV